MKRIVNPKVEIFEAETNGGDKYYYPVITSCKKIWRMFNDCEEYFLHYIANPKVSPEYPYHEKPFYGLFSNLPPTRFNSVPLARIEAELFIKRHNELYDKIESEKIKDIKVVYEGNV